MMTQSQHPGRHLGGSCAGGGFKWLWSPSPLLSSLPWTLHCSDSWHPSPLPQKQTDQPDFSVVVLKVWSRATAFTSPGNLLEMHILRLQARPTESETLRVGLAVCVLSSSPGDSGAPRKFERCCCKGLWQHLRLGSLPSESGRGETGSGYTEPD